jgi:imidazolonepropionase-like amidohydrolase
MWDCHGHFLGARTANLEEILHTPVATLAARATADALRGLNAGFTSIREVGGVGLELSRAIDEGYIPGPHIYGAGAMLSPTGGHGDYHSYSLSFKRGGERADGPWRPVRRGLGVPEGRAHDAPPRGEGD